MVLVPHKRSDCTGDDDLSPSNPNLGTLSSLPIGSRDSGVGTASESGSTIEPSTTIITPVMPPFEGMTSFKSSNSSSSTASASRYTPNSAGKPKKPPVPPKPVLRRKRVVNFNDTVDIVNVDSCFDDNESSLCDDEDDFDDDIDEGEYILDDEDEHIDCGRESFPLSNSQSRDSVNMKSVISQLSSGIHLNRKAPSPLTVPDSHVKCSAFRRFESTEHAGRPVTPSFNNNNNNSVILETAEIQTKFPNSFVATKKSKFPRSNTAPTTMASAFVQVNSKFSNSASSGNLTKFSKTGSYTSIEKVTPFTQNVSGIKSNLSCSKSASSDSGMSLLTPSSSSSALCSNSSDQGPWARSSFSSVSSSSSQSSRLTGISTHSTDSTSSSCTATTPLLPSSQYKKGQIPGTEDVSRNPQSSPCTAMPLPTSEGNDNSMNVPEYEDVGTSSCDKCHEGKCRTLFLHLPELPFGWEKVEDPHYGVYFIDHVNRRTQYENPVHAAKKQAEEVTNTFPRPKKPEGGTKRSASDNNMNGQLYPVGKPLFTTKPEELMGEICRTSLVKTMRGLGFTIVGGNQRDTQFLQIKNVVENGPAYQSGKMKTGDVIVRVNNTCVLGYTHQDVVRLFQSIAPGDTVHIEVCRGYPLNFDLDDPNTEIVTTVAVTLPQDNSNFNNTASTSLPHHNHNGMSSSSSSQQNDSQPQQHSNVKSLPDLARSAGVGIHSPSSLSPSTSQEENAVPPDLVSLSINSRPPEILTIGIVKGPMGFGFTIADSQYGQRVKQILDEGRCKTLAQGDLLVQINGHMVRDMQHQQTVQVLKECPQGMEAQIIVQRGGIPPPGKGRKQLKPSRSFDERPLDSSIGSGVVPGAYFFQNHQDTNISQDNNTIIEEDSNVFPPPPPPLPTVKTTQLGVGQTGRLDDDGHGDENMHRPPPPRPKTPSASDGDSNGLPLPPRCKTPTQSTSSQGYMDMNLGRREVQEELARFGNSNNFNHSYNNPEGRPPAGPQRPDYFPRFNDTRQQQQWGNQNDIYQRSYSSSTAPGGHSNGDDRWAAATYGREVKPGQFRSRTPGPELMNRGGPDQPYGGGMSRSEYQRPKTPTAADMRGAGGKSGVSGPYGSSGDYWTSGRFTPNPSSEQGRQYRPPYQDYGRNWPNFSSPPSQRRYEPFEGISLNRSYAGGEFSRQQSLQGPGRPGGRQSTSFENENPSPSTLTRVPRRPPTQSAFLGNNPTGTPSRSGMAPLDEGTQVVEMDVTLHRQESGYGFRIIGGTEEGSQVSVGHIVPGGAADADGRLRQYDEITHVDGSSVLHASHHRVVELMTNAALNGRVTLSIRRTMGSESNLSQSMTSLQPYDVVVSRRENEGFGFVIISSVNKSGASVDEYIDSNNSHDFQSDKGVVCPWIGHIQENSPAERCGRLHVGDRILAVNGVDTSHMHHKDVVSLIKDSGFSVALTIAPPNDDSSSSNSQKDSDDSGEIYHVELFRGSRGFGFSIRGGREFNAMPLFVLRIAEGGAADLDGHLRVGDQILEINEIPTEKMTHTDAIDIIQNGGASVNLLMRRTNKPPPVFDGSGNSPSSLYAPNIPPTPNGPIGHSSPHMARRQQGDSHQHINSHDYSH